MYKQNGSNLLVPKRILLLGQAKRIKVAWPKEDFVIWTRKRHIESNLLVPKSVIWTSKKDQICLSQKRIFLSFGQAKKIVSSGSGHRVVREVVFHIYDVIFVSIFCRRVDFYKDKGLLQ